jgi:hypothetical protein
MGRTPDMRAGLSVSRLVGETLKTIEWKERRMSLGVTPCADRG